MCFLLIFEMPEMNEVQERAGHDVYERLVQVLGE